MIKLQIRRKTAKVWQHFITDGENFIFSKCYCKTNGDKFRVVEDGGTQKNEYNFDEIEVYDDLNSGIAETFTSSLELMERLSALNYVGFNQDGNVIIADLISSDSSNAVVLGSDDRLFVSSSGGGETPTLQAVTNEGNTTLNEIKIYNPGNFFMELYPNGVYIENQINGDNMSLNSYILQFGDSSFASNFLFRPRTQNTVFYFEDEGGEKSIATREWVNLNTPNFQQVTDEGNTTTNEIQASNFVSAGSGNFGGIIINDGDLNQIGSISCLATPLNSRDYNLPDEDGIIATREWVNDKNNLQWLLKDTTPTTAVTGTTSRTQIGSSILIPANTFSSEDLMNLDSFAVEKIAGLGTCQIQLWHNTSNTLTGATAIAVFSMVNANVSAKMIRTFEITGGLLNGRVAGNVNGISDIGGLSVATLSISFDPTIDNYFFTTVQLGNASDSVKRT
jgi:hypothetical protein